MILENENGIIFTIDSDFKTTCRSKTTSKTYFILLFYWCLKRCSKVHIIFKNLFLTATLKYYQIA